MTKIIVRCSSFRTKQYSVKVYLSLSSICVTLQPHHWGKKSSTFQWPHFTVQKCNQNNKISVHGQIFCLEGSFHNIPFQECNVSNTNSFTDHIKMRNSAALLNIAHRNTLLISVYLCRGHIYPHYHSGPFPIHLMTFSWSRRYAGHREVQSAQTGLMLTEALSNSLKSSSLCYIPSQSPPKAN